MLAVIRLYLLKYKRVPLWITFILALLLLWGMSIKVLIEPNTPIKGNVDLSLTNFGLFIFIFIGMIKRESMEKGGFLLRLPVSDRELVIANIISVAIISIITVVLSVFSIWVILSFYKILGYPVNINYKNFTMPSLWRFAYYIMYLGVIFSIFTFLLQYTSKSTSKLLIIGVPIALLFLVPTILGIVMHTTHIKITEEMIEQFFSKPFWHGVKVVLGYTWKARLVIGLTFTLLVYRVRYLKEV